MKPVTRPGRPRHNPMSGASDASRFCPSCHGRAYPDGRTWCCSGCGYRFGKVVSA